MADQRTMAELLRAPTEGYAEAIVVPPILAEHFELKHSLINMTTSDQFFGLEKDNPHDHIRWFNKITSTIKYKDVPNSAIKLMLFPFSLVGAARRWLEKEPPRSILTWVDLVSKFINEFFPSSRMTNLRNEISNFEQRFGESFHEACYKDLICACPHHGFIEFHQLDTFYNALNPTDQDSLNSAAGGNFLERSTRDVLTIIENKSKIAKLTHVVNQQTSDVTTAMTAILKQFQATPPPASVKAVEEICVTYGGAHSYYQCLAADGNTFPEYRDNIQGYVAAVAGNYNQGNSGYRPPGVANQTRPPAPIQQNQSVPLSELEKIKKINDVNIKAMQAQINNVKNELRNEMQTLIQASMSNKTNELKNMMASFFQMNIASTSGSESLPSNTVANLKGELKAITTRSRLVLDGPSVPMPPPFINPEEDERVEETLTDSELGEFTIKVPPPLVQKAKPPSQRNYVVHQRDPCHPHIPYPSRMDQEKQKEKDERLSSRSYPKNLETLGNFHSVGFNDPVCKAALADLGASINLMPLSVWKKLGLPELISTQMTLELANREICTLVGIARDVFVPVGKFTFPVDFFIVDYESDPRVPLILGRPFLRTARALIDVHGEEMILRDGNERLTLNMRHDTSSYSTQPHQESINMIDVYNVYNEEILEDLFATNHPSGNPTSSLTSHTDLTSPEVNDDIFDPEGDIIKNLLNLDKTKYLPPHHVNPLSGNPTQISETVTKSSSSSLTLISIEESDLIWEEFEAYLASNSFSPRNSNPSSPLPHFHNSLRGSTTSSSPSLPISENSDYSLEEFADELAHFTFPPEIDYLPFDAESDL
ncbi:reverse transcriptase domain-containing protein [Tanacetum coccineum]